MASSIVVRLNALLRSKDATQMRVLLHTMVVLVGSLYITACGMAEKMPNPHITRLNVPAEVIDFPVAENSVTWLPDDKLLITTESSGKLYGMGEPISYLLRDGSFLELRHFPIETNCSVYAYHVNGVLPDGRLGLVTECNIHDKPNQGPTEELTLVLAYDWNSGATEQLVEQSIPPIGALWFSWNPEMTRGIQEAGSLLSTIMWLTPEKTEPMDIIVEDGSRRWSLADNYAAMLVRESDVEELGRASSPAWSPNGEQIAFFASLDAIGHSGISRATGEYQLYLMDAELLQPEPILDRMYFADGLTWSPNGRWLAFTGQRPGYCSSDECLWLFSPEREVLIQVTDDAVIGRISWSPDGKRLITARKCNDCQTEDTTLMLSNGDSIQLPACRAASCREIVIYDVGNVISGEE
jgi:hypothetical protein